MFFSFKINFNILKKKIIKCMLYEAQQNDDGVDKMHQRSKRRSPAFAPGAELQQAC